MNELSEFLAAVRKRSTLGSSPVAIFSAKLLTSHDSVATRLRSQGPDGKNRRGFCFPSNLLQPHCSALQLRRGSFLSLLPLKFLQCRRYCGKRIKKKRSPRRLSRKPAPVEGLTNDSIVVAHCQGCFVWFPHHTFLLFIYLNLPLSPGFIPVVAVVAVVPGGFFFFFFGWNI